MRQRLKTGENLEVRVLDRSQKNELAVGRLDTTDNVIDLTTGTVKLRRYRAGAPARVMEARKSPVI